MKGDKREQGDGDVNVLVAPYIYCLLHYIDLTERNVTQRTIAVSICTDELQRLAIYTENGPVNHRSAADARTGCFVKVDDL